MDITTPVMEILTQVEHEAVSRSFQASNELRNAALIVLRGKRSGRRYRLPYTSPGRTVGANGKTIKKSRRYYTASAPGEAPAVRTGAYRLSYRPVASYERKGGVTTIYAGISSDYKVNGKLLGEILEERKNRPHRQRIIETAKPAVKRIYSKTYVRR